MIVTSLALRNVAASSNTSLTITVAGPVVSPLAPVPNPPSCSFPVQEVLSPLLTSHAWLAPAYDWT